MSLSDRAQADWKRFSSNTNHWGTAINVETPSGSFAVDVAGMAVKHHLKVDGEGLVTNAKNAHCTISESLLTDAGYTVRDSDMEVSMVNHRVEWKDSTGILKKYVVLEAWSDEKVGVIVFVLGDFE